MVVIISVVIVYYSPEYTWSNSMKDDDGDGVRNGLDDEPADPSIWSYDVGWIHLSILNSADEVKNFTVFGNPSADRGIADANASLFFDMRVLWNNSRTTSVTLLVREGYYSGRMFSMPTWTDSVVVVDGDITTIDLVFPDDFPQSK